MKVFLDHDRAPIGIRILSQGTFFAREANLDDALVARLNRILDAGEGIRSILARVYEQPDHKVRAAVLESHTEELKRLCVEVVQDGKQKLPDSVVPLSVKSPRQRKPKASNSGTNRKTE